MSDAENRDYLPFVKGAVWEYKRVGKDPDGTERFEILSVAEKKGQLEAKIRSTSTKDGKTEVSEVTLTKGKDGLFSDGDVEFPLPPKKGKKWKIGGAEYEILGHDTSVKVPAGKYKDCMKIFHKIGTGDEGTGYRLFAPGVGLVYEEAAEESGPYILSLTRVTMPAG